MDNQPIFLICGCEKYRSNIIIAIARNQRPDWKVIGIVGGSETVQYDQETSILSLPVEDTYDTLPTKIHAAISWCFETFPETRGVFKTDEDIEIADLDALSVILTTTDELYKGLKVDNCKKTYIRSHRMKQFRDRNQKIKHQAATYCWGAGYWIHRDAIPHIIAASGVYKTSYLEDICTGYVLNNAEILPTELGLTYTEVPRS